LQFPHAIAAGHAREAAFDFLASDIARQSVTGISTDVCLAFPAIAALADGFESYAVIDASGGFTQTQVDMGVLRMVQAGVIPVSYSNVAVEILADNAAPEAEAVYGAISMPFSGLVFGLRQYYSHA
jgi:hypothetical protein